MDCLTTEQIELLSVGAIDPVDAEAMRRFVVGERHIKAGRTTEAIREYEASIAAEQPPHEWYGRFAEARLRQLRATASAPSGQADGEKLKQGGS